MLLQWNTRPLICRTVNDGPSTFSAATRAASRPGSGPCIPGARSEGGGAAAGAGIIRHCASLVGPAAGGVVVGPRPRSHGLKRQAPRRGGPVHPLKAKSERGGGLAPTRSFPPTHSGGRQCRNASDLTGHRRTSTTSTLATSRQPSQWLACRQRGGPPGRGNSLEVSDGSSAGGALKGTQPPS